MFSFSSGIQEAKPLLHLSSMAKLINLQNVNYFPLWEQHMIFFVTLFLFVSLFLVFKFSSQKLYFNVDEESMLLLVPVQFDLNKNIHMN